MATAQVSAASPKKEASGDLELIRFSVWQYLRSARDNEQFLLDYSSDHAAVMDELRMQGWIVNLQVGMKGDLAFMISANRPGMMA